MAGLKQRLLFDPPDHELLSIVNEVLNRRGRHRQFKSLFTPHLHPNGIKEMAAPKDLRVAYAVIHLLDSLQTGLARDRLDALRAVRDEVLHCARSHLRVNTGRVLVQIMKQLVRAHGDPERQLRLAHDFRLASSGKPRIVRRQLQRHHLLEMPEDWSQISFDDHVHDANTKGRKFPTHLVLDAWIKGIRSLTVIHYNHISPPAAAELLEAAEIMGIKVRIGLEFSCLWQGRFVNLIWSPRGFSGAKDFVAFLEQPEVAGFMARGREVSEYQQARVLQALDGFNQRGRARLRQETDLDLEPLEPAEFLAYVGSGQASMLHLAQYVHQHLLAVMGAETAHMRRAWASASQAERAAMAGRVERWNRLLPEKVAQDYLCEPDGRPFTVLRPDAPGLPELARHSAGELLSLLAGLRAGARVTLNLSGLDPADVLELIHECRGGITHLENFNLKDYVGGRYEEYIRIGALQEALNSGNAVVLKHCIRDIIEREAGHGAGDAEARRERLLGVLRGMDRLGEYYRHTPLKSRLGSDSTGRSGTSPGMGLVVADTLPGREQRALRRRSDTSRHRLPVLSLVHQEVAYRDPRAPAERGGGLARWLRRLPGLEGVGLEKKRDWRLDGHLLQPDLPGNLVSLGGGFQDGSNRLHLEPAPHRRRRAGYSWAYVNTGVKNLVKVLIGFIPAALTFGLTHHWWVLAVFGAPIWFAITGARNILQSVLGGGGIRRSPVLRWNNYVSWSRLADSLMFTGFSVPLLDLLVKTVILDRGLDITVHTSPAAVYTVVSLTNGLYLTTHNLLRGLPRSAAVANFFRSVLAIPLAMAFSAGLGWLAGLCGMPAVDLWLQDWAAVISKAASDCVAGVIEGLADRAQNLRVRAMDYYGKLSQLFSAYARLEVLFPEEDMAGILAKPKELLHHDRREAAQLGEVLIIHSLDLMYFWMYQPRAQSMFPSLLARLGPEERRIVLACQGVLSREREISQLFVDGLVGRRFSRALSFYLDTWRQYLDRCQAMISRMGVHDRPAASRLAPGAATALGMEPPSCFDRAGQETRGLQP